MALTEIETVELDGMVIDRFGNGRTQTLLIDTTEAHFYKGMPVIYEGRRRTVKDIEHGRLTRIGIVLM